MSRWNPAAITVRHLPARSPLSGRVYDGSWSESIDPFPQVAGRGIQHLRQAGLQVETGCRRVEAEALNAPYFHRLRTGHPWFIGKWAMTLDGRVATDTGESQWISGLRSPAARA